MRIARAGFWAAGAALCGLKLAGTLHGHVDGGFYVGNALSTATGNVYVVSHKLAYAEFVVALVMITLGVLVWDRRPDSRTGILLTAVPIVGLVSSRNATDLGAALERSIAAGFIAKSELTVERLVALVEEAR